VRFDARIEYLAFAIFELYDDWTYCGSQVEFRGWPFSPTRLRGDAMTISRPFNLTPDAGSGATSLSARVAEVLLAKIRDGELTPGSRLPSEEALAKA
jgi:hypothetical protein